MGDSPFGNYIRNHRLRAGVSCRRLARGLGISPVFLGEVERGARASLARERWDRLRELIPTITLEGLERNAAKSGVLQLDLIDAPPQYQNIGYALARRIERKTLSGDDCERLLELLGRWGEDDNQ